MSTAHLISNSPAESAHGWLAGLMARLGSSTPLAAPAMPPAGAEQSLARDGLHCADLRAGREIRCLQGHLWLTFHGDPSDVFLDAGQSWCGRARGPALIQALKPARFQVL